MKNLEKNVFRLARTLEKKYLEQEEGDVLLCQFGFQLLQPPEHKPEVASLCVQKRRDEVEGHTDWLTTGFCLNGKKEGKHKRVHYFFLPHLTFNRLYLSPVLHVNCRI